MKEANVKTDFRKMGAGLDLTGLGQCLVTGFRENGNETFGSIKAGTFSTSLVTVGIGRKMLG
jgi:hypothetical protein